VAVAAFVKGAIGFGFPGIATPVVALVADVRTAVVVLLVPNLVMDAWQLARRPGLGRAVRRHAALLAAGVAGMALGTQVMLAVPPAVLLAGLGGVTLAAVGLGLARPGGRLPARLEAPLGPVAGFAAGLMGGLTNVVGVPLILYFQGVGLERGEFVRAVAAGFLTLKATQLVAVWRGVPLDPGLAGPAVAVLAVGLAAFAVGLQVQDRVEPAAFRRWVLGVMAVLGVAMLARAAWG
jgi:uncharacterized membrane protein YfcA